MIPSLMSDCAGSRSSTLHIDPCGPIDHRGGEWTGRQLTHGSIPEFLVPLVFIEVVKHGGDVSLEGLHSRTFLWRKTIELNPHITRTGGRKVDREGERKEGEDEERVFVIDCQRGGRVRAGKRG